MPFDPQNPGSTFYSQVGAVNAVKNQLDSKKSQLVLLQAQVASLQEDITALEVSLADAQGLLITIVSN